MGASLIPRANQHYEPKNPPRLCLPQPLVLFPLGPKRLKLYDGMSLDHHLCFRDDSDRIDSGNANTHTHTHKISGDSNENSVERMALVTVVTVLMMLIGVQMLIMSMKVILMVEGRRGGQ